MSKPQKTTTVMHNNPVPPPFEHPIQAEPTEADLLQADLIVAKAVAYDALGVLSTAEKEYNKHILTIHSIEEKIANATRD